MRQKRMERQWRRNVMITWRWVAILDTLYPSHLFEIVRMFICFKKKISIELKGHPKKMASPEIGTFSE